MLFCAHSVFYFKLKAFTQDSFLVHENVYLIQAESALIAMVKAEMISKAKEDLSEDGHLELNEKKVSYIYAGVRKIIEADCGLSDINLGVLNGLEITYSELEVDSIDEVLLLARGSMVNVLYRE